jgi:translation initiation factor IF-3
LKEQVRINSQIRAETVRVIGHDGANLGILSLPDAVERARAVGLDLIEISPLAVPPVARIMDYGKFQYEQNKKQKEIKSKAKVTETKNVQVKIATSEHDSLLKAKKSTEWLLEGHRVKIDLFLWGRYKSMPFEFHKERLERFLDMVSAPYKIADDIKKSPKGLSITIEHDAGNRSKPKIGTLSKEAPLALENDEAESEKS